MILDTNALSAVAANDLVVAGIAAAAQQLALPVVVIGEYLAGIARSRHSSHYRQWFDALIGDCQVLDVTHQTANHYATISLELRRLGTPIPTNDLWIAALSKQHSLPILSRDRHFDFVHGLKRLGW